MENGKKNIVGDKSFDFALSIIKIVQDIQSNKKEFILSKQLVRSGTAIGAMVREAEHVESKKVLLIKWQ